VARNPSTEEISTNSNVIWLSDATPKNLPVIGLKALNLSILQRLKLPVQPAFCITTHAYRRCLESFGIVLDQSQNMNFQEALQMGRLIQHSFFKYPLPVDVLSDIRNAYRQLTHPQEVAVALRPSLPYPDPFFAKRLRPMLNIRGMIEFEKALKIAWAYIWLDEIVAYRFSQETLTQRLDDLAIIVQPFAQPVVSGSLLSFHPGSNSDQEMLIEAAWGQNEAVSRGLLSPDQFIWQRFLKKISRQTIASKPFYFAVEEDGSLAQRELEVSRQKQASLNETDLLILAEMAEKAVAGYKRPLELEWIKTERGFQFIQAQTRQQPTTNVVQESEWEKLDTVASYFRQPFSPLGWSFLHPLLEQALKNTADYLGITGLPEPAFRLINYTAHWHQSIPKLFQQALVSYQTDLNEQARWKQFWQVGSSFYKAQHTWRTLYQEYLEKIQRFWENDPAGGEAEVLLQEMDNLADSVQGLLDALLMVRCLNLTGQPLLTGLLQDYFQDQEHPPVYDILFQGLPGRKSQSLSQMDLMLEKIHSEPRLLALFKNQPAHTLWDQLQSQESGPEFLNLIKESFGLYGYYRTGLDPLYPSWVDAPHSILQELQEAIQHQRIFWDTRIPNQREELTHLIFETIGPWKLPDILLIRIILHLTQTLSMTREDEPYFISMFLPVLRRMMGGISRFLPLDSQQDIFYLETNEIRHLLETPLNAFRIKELKELIQARKYERKIGNKLGNQARQKLESLELQGLPANTGQYLGKARIILRSDDLKELRQGEILITDYFEPAWEPALAKAGALVMELGGSLSHGAQLARQYKLPAIACLPQATRKLKNGYVLRLDGTTGQISAYQAEALEKQEDFVS